MRPQIISQLDRVFPTNVSHLMPNYADIPDDFKSWNNPWNKLAATWFYEGISTANWRAKEGIDRDQAIGHLTAVIGSFEPDHNHKMAAVAYLISLWFEIPD